MANPTETPPVQPIALTRPKYGDPLENDRYRTWYLQSRRKGRKKATVPINDDPEFNDGDAEWDTELTGNLTGAADFGVPGQVAMTSTLLGSVRLRQLGILVVGLTYRVEIDVSTFGAGPVLLFNGAAELDFNVTGAGTFVVEFIADSADFIIGLKLGLLRAVTCTAVRVLRHG